MTDPKYEANPYDDCEACGALVGRHTLYRMSYGVVAVCPTKITNSPPGNRGTA